MCDFGLYVFREGTEGFFHQTVEKVNSLKNAFVALFQVLGFVVRRQVFDELRLLVDVGELFDVRVLFDEVIDLPIQLFGHFVLLGQFLEHFEVSVLLFVLHSDVVYEGAHTVNVIGEDHAADGLHEDHNQRLLIAARSDVSEADGQHDCGAPIVRPNVFLEPHCLLQLLGDDPIAFWVHIRHAEECHCEHVGVEEVEEEDLDQRPVLLFVVVFDEEYFQLFDLLEPVRQLEEHQHFAEVQQSHLGRSH